MSVRNRRLTSCLVVMCVASTWLDGCVAQKVYDRVVEKNRERFESKGGAGHKGIVCEKFRVTMWPEDDQAMTGDESKPEIKPNLDEDRVNDRSTRNLKNPRDRGGIEFDGSDEVPLERSYTSFAEEPLVPLDASESQDGRPLLKKYHQAQRRRRIKNYLIDSIVNILIDVNDLMELNEKIFADLKGELIHRSRGGCKNCLPALGATTDHYMHAQFALCGTLERGLKFVELSVNDPRKLLAIRKKIASAKRSNDVKSSADCLKARLTNLLAIAEECNDDDDRLRKINNLKRYLSSLRVKEIETLNDLLPDSTRHPSIKSGAAIALAPRRPITAEATQETRRVSPGIRDTRRRIVRANIAEKIEIFDYLMKFLRKMPEIISVFTALVDGDCLAGSGFAKGPGRPAISSSPVYDRETEEPEAAHGIDSHKHDNHEDARIFESNGDIDDSDEFSESNKPISGYDEETFLPGINRAHSHRPHHKISAAFSPSSFENTKYSSTFLENDVFREIYESAIDSPSDDSRTADHFASLFPYCAHLNKLRDQRFVDSYDDPLNFQRGNSHLSPRDSTVSRDDFNEPDEINFPSTENNDRKGDRVDLRVPTGKARAALGANAANPGDYIAIGVGHCTLIGKLTGGGETIDFRLHNAPLKSLKPNPQGAGEIWKVPTENFVNFVGEDELKKLQKNCHSLYHRSSSPRRYRYRRMSTVYEKDYDF